MKPEKNFWPDRVLSYFRLEWLPLAFVTLSGLVYNIGLLATPWFEGRLAQCLADILGGSETAAKMAVPFQTRFRFGSGPEVLNLAAYNRSPDRSTKSTLSRFDAL